MKSRLFFIALGLLLAASAGFVLGKKSTPAGPVAGVGGGAVTKGGAVRATPAPLAVTGVKMAAVPFAETITASGTLRAEESIELQTELNGKVVALNFQEGQRVNAGDVLLKIDDATQQANLRRALARRELATLRERRLGRLVAEGGVSQLEFDEAKGELAVLDAEIEVIRAEIAKTQIRAPFDAVVGLRFVSLGAYVTPATRIATLQGIARLKLDFSVPERYASLARTGDPLRFSVAGDARAFVGEVYAVEPRIEVSTRSILLRAVCSNPDGRILPGNFARVEYTVQKSADALLVPSIAIISGLEERFLFVEKEGVAKRVKVVTGARTDRQVQILEGLAPGDVVITSGVQQLRPGLPVTVRIQS